MAIQASIAKDSHKQESEVQTDPIMVPFPLPPIGTVKVVVKEVESVSMQTDYTWLFNEFPTRNPIAVSSTLSHPVKPLSTPSPKKKAAIKQPVTVSIAEEDTQIPDTRMAETTPEVSQTPEVPEPVPVVAEPVEIEAPVTPAKKKTKSPRKAPVETTPATPVSTAAPETPMGVFSPATASPKRSVSLPPVLSDSSDDERISPLAVSKPVTKPTTTMAPVTKPAAVASPKPTVIAPPVLANDDSSSSEDEAGPASSSSDSDADVPTVAAIATSNTKKRKTAPTASPKKVAPVASSEPVVATPTASPTKAARPGTPSSEPLPVNTRLGPLVQVDEVDESNLSTIHSAILALIPEPLQSGSIKAAVFDEAHKRIIFQLRISPKVAHFLTANGGVVNIDEDNTRTLSVLNEAQKKKASHLFAGSEENSVVIPLAKRRK